MLLAGVLLIIVIFAIAGWRKGLIGIVLSLVSLVITIAAGLVLSPLLTEAVRNSGADKKMEESVYEFLINNEEINKYFDSENDITLPDNLDLSQSSQYVEQFQEVVSNALEKANFPESLANSFENVSQTDLAELVSKYQGSTVKEMCLRVIAERLTDIMLTAIIYVVVIIIVFVVLRIIIGATGLVGRLPVIRQANKIGGLAFGLVEGLVVVWIFFTLITAASGTEAVSNIMLQIHNNSFLEMLYNNNPITRILFSIV